MQNTSHILPTNVDNSDQCSDFSRDLQSLINIRIIARTFMLKFEECFLFNNYEGKLRPFIMLSE